jgi:hypothetical protein
MRLATRPALVSCLALLGCGLAVRRPVVDPPRRYTLSGFSVVGPQGRGWWVTGGRQVTNDWLFLPQDRDLYAPSRANFLMFSQVWYWPKARSTTGAFALREPFALDADGLAGLEARIVARLPHEVTRSHFARYDVALEQTHDLGRPCLRLSLHLEFKTWTTKPELPRVHRGVRYWCPASLAEGSPVVRMGYFEEHRIDDPPPRDFLPDALVMMRSLAFVDDDAR